MVAGGGDQDAVRFTVEAPSVENTSADSVLDTMLSCQFLQQKTGVANFILQQATKFAAHTAEHQYSPLQYNHTSDSARNTYTRYMTILSASDQCQEQGHGTGYIYGPHHESWDKVEHKTTTPSYDAPPLYSQRRISHNLSGTCIWHYSDSLISFQQICLQVDGPPSKLNFSPHAVCVFHYFVPPDGIGCTWF